MFASTALTIGASVTGDTTLLFVAVVCLVLSAVELATSVVIIVHVAVARGHESATAHAHQSEVGRD